MSCHFPCTTLHCLFLGYGVNVESKWFPPIADPAVWRVFVDNTIDTNGPRDGRVVRDPWQRDEFVGDKFMAHVAGCLVRKYEISHPWSHVLISVLCSNEYQKKMCRVLGLPAHLVSGPIGKKGSSDTLEVIINNHSHIVAD